MNTDPPQSRDDSALLLRPVTPADRRRNSDFGGTSAAEEEGLNPAAMASGGVGPLGALAAVDRGGGSASAGGSPNYARRRSDGHALHAAAAGAAAAAAAGQQGGPAAGAKGMAGARRAQSMKRPGGAGELFLPGLMGS